MRPIAEYADVDRELFERVVVPQRTAMLRGLLPTGDSWRLDLKARSLGELPLRRGGR